MTRMHAWKYSALLSIAMPIIALATPPEVLNPTIAPSAGESTIAAPEAFPWVFENALVDELDIEE